MQAVHREAQASQLVRQGGGVELGVTEHHHPLVALADDDLGQVRQLVAAGGLQHVLGDLGLALLLGLHGDLLGVVLVQPAMSITSRLMVAENMERALRAFIISMMCRTSL